MDQALSSDPFAPWTQDCDDSNDADPSDNISADCVKFCGSNPHPTTEVLYWYNNYFQQNYNAGVSWGRSGWDNYGTQWQGNNYTDGESRSPHWTAYYGGGDVYTRFLSDFPNGRNRTCGPGFAMFPASSIMDDSDEASEGWTNQHYAWWFRNPESADTNCDQGSFSMNNKLCGECPTGYHCGISLQSSYCVVDGGGHASHAWENNGGTNDGSADTNDPYTDIESGGGGFNDPFDGEGGPDLPVPGTCTCAPHSGSYQCHANPNQNWPGVNDCNSGFEPVCDIDVCTGTEPGDNPGGDALCAPGNEITCENIDDRCHWEPFVPNPGCYFYEPPNQFCCGLHPNCSCQSNGLLSSNSKQHFTNGVFDQHGNEWEDETLLRIYLRSDDAVDDLGTHTEDIE